MVRTNRQQIAAFSLIEVVIAIGICSFALIAILGLFTTGLQSTKESEKQIQAADLASTMISLKCASPTNDISSLSNFAIKTYNMTNAVFSFPSQTTGYVGTDGQTTNTAAYAAFRYTYAAGTTASGSGLSQVYLMLSWPPQATAATAAGRYEITTYIPTR
jgi:uncharacterized protein (TIGR02598 family)